jgi:hypothetical protein
MIDEKILNSIKSGKTVSQYNSNDPVVIINPCDDYSDY